MRSYLDPDLSPRQRVEYAFYALYVTEAWYTDLKERSGPAKAQKEAERKAKEARRRAEDQQRLKEIIDERKERDHVTINKKTARLLLSEEKKAKKELEKKRKLEARAAAQVRARAAPAATHIPASSAAPPPAAPASLPTVAQQFITRPAATGIAINAWFLLGHLHFLVTSRELNIPFNTRLLTEQAAEKVFRAARAVLGGENFTLPEFFRRCDRFMALAVLRQLHRHDFVFHEHDSSWKWDERHRSDHHAGPLPDSFMMEEVLCGITDAKLACVADMLQLNVDVNKFKAVYSLDEGTLKELDKDEADAGDVADEEDYAPPPAAEAEEMVVRAVCSAPRTHDLSGADRGARPSTTICASSNCTRNGSCGACWASCVSVISLIACAATSPPPALLCKIVSSHQPAAAAHQVRATRAQRSDVLRVQAARLRHHQWPPTQQQGPLVARADDVALRFFGAAARLEPGGSDFVENVCKNRPKKPICSALSSRRDLTHTWRFPPCREAASKRFEDASATTED